MTGCVYTYAQGPLCRLRTSTVLHSVRLTSSRPSQHTLKIIFLLSMSANVDGYSTFNEEYIIEWEP
jgi:hypothetical protein